MEVTPGVILEIILLVDANVKKDVESRMAKDIENFLREERHKKAKKAIESRHSQKGGSRETKEQVIKLWNETAFKFKSKTDFAHKKADSFNISPTTIIKYLRNIKISTK